ncbi:MAG: FG-GAP repeat protein [Candidatus Aminicenantes bacterium]|nr:FG-GAP repeat protein [Candidatus Aminicenantes bacterium]
MKMKFPLMFLLGASACLFLVGCQANDDVTPQDTFRSLLKLVPNDPVDNGSFGMSVAVDGAYALAGAPGEDGNGANSGAAYLFLQSQGGLDGWGQIKKLIASDAAAGDVFGVSVAVSGDYALVGAEGEDGTGSEKGAAYLFYRNQGGTDNWGEVKKIVASDAASDDTFGYSVAIDGDYLIVGADGEDGAGTDRGAAYLFYRNQGGADNWGQLFKLTADDAADSNRFGYRVDIDGDFILAGSPYSAGAGTNRGAAYLFYRNQGGADNWGQFRKILPSDPANEVWFGSALSIDGDLLVIGAAWDDSGGTNRGAAYLFSRNQGGADNWGQIKKLAASDAQNDDFFGFDVKVAGDFVVAGALFNGGGGTERGQVYLFSKNEGGADNWGQAQRLRASDGVNQDWFGSAVDLDGLYLLSGATGQDGAGTNRGAVYMFRKI